MRYSIFASTALVGAALGSAIPARQPGTSTTAKRDEVELIEHDEAMCKGDKNDFDSFKKQTCQFIFQFDFVGSMQYQINVASHDDYNDNEQDADWLRLTTGNHEYSFTAWRNQNDDGLFTEGFDRCSVNQGDGVLANGMTFNYSFPDENGDGESVCKLQLTGNPPASGDWLAGEKHTSCFIYSDCTVFEP